MTLCSLTRAVPVLCCASLHRAETPVLMEEPPSGEGPEGSSNAWRMVEAAGFEPASEKRVRRRLRVYSRFEVSRLTRHVPEQPARLASPA